MSSLSLFPTRPLGSPFWLPFLGKLSYLLWMGKAGHPRALGKGLCGSLGHNSTSFSWELQLPA